MTVKLFKLDWVPLRLAAVVVATSGAMAVIYGSSTSPHNSDTSIADSHDSKSSSPVFKPSTALIGDSLTLLAAIIYGVYQVLYKKYVALPTDPDAELDGLDVPPSALYTPVPEDPDERTHVLPPIEQEAEEDMVYPPPFALYPNLLTSAIGVCTFFILWLPIPILHWTGIKPFHLPPDSKTAAVIIGIALSGVVFNASFMVRPSLLSLFHFHE